MGKPVTFLHHSSDSTSSRDRSFSVTTAELSERPDSWWLPGPELSADLGHLPYLDLKEKELLISIGSLYILELSILFLYPH